MGDFQLKIRHIYLPFLYVSLATLLGYSVINYLVFDGGVLKIHNKWSIYFIPTGIVLLTHLIFLLRRIKFLSLARKRGKDLYSFYYLMACLITLTPIFISQTYISEDLGELITIDDVSNINQKNPAKFYKINKYYLDTVNIIQNCVTTVSGKHNQHLNFTEYVATPVYPEKYYSLWHMLHAMRAPDSGIVILNWQLITHAEFDAIPFHKLTYKVGLNSWDGGNLFREAGQKGVVIASTKDTTGYTYDMTKLGYRRPIIWMGWRRQETISNRFDGRDNQILWEGFLRRMQKEFESETFKGIKYFHRVPFSDNLVNFNNTITGKDRWSPDHQLIYMPVYNNFEDRAGDKLLWLLATFILGQLIWFMMLLSPTLIRGKLKYNLKPKFEM